MPDTNRPEDEGILIRSFEARHPALAVIWRMVLRRPFTGLLTALVFVAASMIILETGNAANTLFQKWANVNWYAPFEASIRAKAVNEGEADSAHRLLHIGDWVEAKQPLTFYAVDGGTAPPQALMTLTNIQSEDPDVLAREAEHVSRGQKMAPIFDGDQHLAVTDGYAYVWDGDYWGLVPLNAYRAAGLPEKDRSQ
jgi:hypothetical protein